MHPVLQNIFISFMHPVAVSDAASTGEAVALDLPPSGATAELLPNSDGDMETCAQAEMSEVANTEPSRVHLAEVACSPSEADSGAPQQPRGEPVHTDATQPMGSPHLTYAETIAQLEALLQGYRDFDDTGRDITDATLVYADPPPIYLRQVRA